MAIDDKIDGLQRLVQIGKEKGYVLYDDVSDVLPADVSAAARGSKVRPVCAGKSSYGAIPEGRGGISLLIRFGNARNSGEIVCRTMFNARR